MIDEDAIGLLECELKAHPNGVFGARAGAWRVLGDALLAGGVAHTVSWAGASASASRSAAVRGCLSRTPCSRFARALVLLARADARGTGVQLQRLGRAHI